LPFVAHTGWCAAWGRLRWEHIAVLIAALALFAGGARAKRFFVGVYPIALVGLLYDTMGAFATVGLSRERVHVCDLRACEIALFGIHIDARPATVHDWLQAHPAPALDAICAVPYATFLLVCVACAAWLYVRSPERMLRFGWCFFALNVAAFVTYRLYPAAPPWYYHAHGCTVDVFARASEGPNLARVDAWLGIPYFAGMYRRSSSVFGAMPSLHCAYPLLVAFEGWAFFGTALRIAALCFFGLMCFAAVYLDHHWVLDALVGASYSAVVAGTARVWAWRRRRG
jgi:hypothetical protein